MRNKTPAEHDSATRLRSSTPWRVVAVHPISDHALAVQFADGTHGEVELAELLANPHPGVFAALRDPSVFRCVRIEHGAVTWPGEIDLAPDAMYDDIRQTGKSTPK